MTLRRRLRLARELTRLSAALVVERLTTGYVFNPMALAASSDPYRHYATLREHDPVHRSFAARGWFVFRHADCLRVLRDDRFSADDRHLPIYATRRRWAIEDGLADPNEPDEPVMLRRDPPDHTRLRRLVSKAFTPRAVERLRPRVQEIADELLTEAARRGSIDLIEDFAVPLPITVIAEMLGVPAKDRKTFKRWSDHLVGVLDPLAAPPPRVLRRTMDELRTYLEALANERRREPADDLLTALVQAEDAGDRLSTRELQGTIALLLAAGNETTTNLIGNGMLTLLREPEERERFRTDPAVAETAIDELVRWESPVQLTMRIPTEEVEVAGAVFRPGQSVIAVLGAANRDPAVFDEPDRLDLGRSAGDHLSFGHGVHYCLGAQLARLEGQVALGELVRRFPDMTLATDRVRWRRLTFLRGLEALPVRL